MKFIIKSDGTLFKNILFLRFVCLKTKAKYSLKKRSSSWYSVDNETKDKLELKIENDGEFWISYDDWLNNFDNCQIYFLAKQKFDNSTPVLLRDILIEKFAFFQNIIISLF